MAKTFKDITKEGLTPLKGVRNEDLYSDQGYELLKQQAQSSQRREASVASGDIGYSSFGDESMYEPQKVDLDYGSSTYDEGLLYNPEQADVQNQRASSQLGITQLGAGLAKGVVLAGTTFIDGTLGLIYGAGTAINEQRFSGIWDNDFSKTMQAINEESERLMPNYYSTEDEAKTFNLGSANFWGDKFIKNIGFAVGAFYSGGVWAAPFKTAKFANIISKVVSSTRAPGIIAGGVGTTISALNEGRIEALNNSKDWAELQTMKLNDATSQKLDEIYAQYGDTEESLQLMAQVQSQHKESLAQLEEGRIKMGNANLIMNMPVLMASNIVQFGRLYANGFKTARKASGIIGKAGEATTNMTAKKGISRALLNPLSEGTEEIMQKAASTISGDYYEDKFENFYKAKLDPDAEQKTVGWMKSFAQGMNETFSDAGSWEEFFIGTLTGALGIPTFGKSFTKNADIGKGKAVGLSGGIYGEYQAYKQEMQKEQEIADYVNERANSPEFLNYYQSLIRHNSYDNKMSESVENNDEFEFKNAEHAQLVNDISMFDNAGKLSELKTMIETGAGISKDNLDAIIRNTTTVSEPKVEGELPQLAGPFAQYAKVEDGQIISTLSEGKQTEEMGAKLTANKDKILSTIDDYSKTREKLDLATNQILSNDQLSELTWLKTQVNNWDKRGNEIAESIKPAIESLIGHVNKKLQLISLEKTKEGASSITPTKRYEELSKQEAGLVNRQQQLEQYSQLSPELLNFILSNPESNEEFKGLIDIGIKEKLFDKKDADDYKSKLNDTQKMAKFQKQYKSRLNDYMKNPDMLIEDIQKVKEEAVDNLAKQKISEMTDVTNVQELKKALASLDEQLVPKVLENLMNSEDPKFKKLGEDFNELSKAKKIMGDLFGDIKVTPVAQSMANVVTDAFEAANTVEEAENIINDFIISNNDENDDNFDVSRGLTSLLQDYKQAIKASKSTTTDVNEPKAEKKRKARKVTQTGKVVQEGEVTQEGKVVQEGKTGSLFDKFSDTANGEVTGQGKGKVVENGGTDTNGSEYVEIVGGSEEASNADNNSGPDPGAVREPSLRSWTSTKYDFNELKNKLIRKIKSRLSGGKGLRNDVDALNDLGAFEFVDSGRFGKLILKKPKTKVHYILSKDPLLKEKVLLAIEVTPDVLKIVGNTINPITIDGRSYQVVGSLGYQSSDTSHVAQNNYNDLKRSVKKESGDFKENYFVSTKYYNQVKHMYSGRMVKSDENNGVEERPVNREFLAKHNGEFHLGFYYGDGNFKTPTINQSQELIEPLNSNNPNLRAGSIWLMTQEADGKWYAKHINVKRFSEEEFSLQENYNTPIVQELAKQLQNLADPLQSKEQRLEAKRAIEAMLYFPNGKKITFKEIEKDGQIVDVQLSIPFLNKYNVAAKAANLQEKANMLLDLLQSPELDLRFQIQHTQMTDKAVVDRLLESGILTTDLLQPQNVNASFDLYLADTVEGGPIKIESAEVGTGHTGNRNIDSSINSITVTMGRKKYHIFNDGKITDIKGKVITDQNTLSEIRLKQNINNKLNKPYKNSTLYLSTYESGEEFGIINSTIFTGEKLKQKKEQADKDDKKITQMKNAEAVVAGREEITDEFLNRAVETSIISGGQSNTEYVESKEDKKILDSIGNFNKIGKVSLRERVEIGKKQGGEVTFENGEYRLYMEARTKTYTFWPISKSEFDYFNSLDNQASELKDKPGVIEEVSTISNGQQLQDKDAKFFNDVPDGENMLGGPVAVNGIYENYTETVLNGETKQTGKEKVIKYLRLKANKAQKQALFDKFGVNSINQVIEKIKALRNVVNMDTLISDEQVQGFINEIIECK